MFDKAFENFRNSDEFVEALTKATRASFGGSGYSVELFEDGRYRVLWNNSIGNLYQSDGIIIGIPPLRDDEFEGFDEDEPLENVVQWYANEIAEEMQATLVERLAYEEKEARYA